MTLNNEQRRQQSGSDMEESRRASGRNMSLKIWSYAAGGFLAKDRIRLRASSDGC